MTWVKITASGGTANVCILTSIVMTETLGGGQAAVGGTEGWSSGTDYSGSSFFPGTGYWNSNVEPTQSIWYHFATPVNIVEVRAKPLAGYESYAGTSWTIYFSDDGTNWTAAGTFSGLVWSTGVEKSFPLTLPAPVITSPATADGQLTVPFVYQITASNLPTSFGATNLPAALSINTSTGLISGTPTVKETRTIGLSATNGNGTGTANLTLTVGDAPVQTYSKHAAMLMNFKAVAHLQARSLRFSPDYATKLYRNPLVAGNRSAWTASMWVKKCSSGYAQQLLSAGGSVGTTIYFDSSDRLVVQLGSGFDSLGTITTTAVYRDPTGWYHVVVAVDTMQATPSDRVKLYVNMDQVTDFATASYPNQA